MVIPRYFGVPRRNYQPRLLRISTDITLHLFLSFKLMCGLKILVCFGFAYFIIIIMRGKFFYSKSISKFIWKSRFRIHIISFLLFKKNQPASLRMMKNTCRNKLSGRIIITSSGVLLLVVTSSPNEPSENDFKRSLGSLD